WSHRPDGACRGGNRAFGPRCAVRAHFSDMAAVEVRRPFLSPHHLVGSRSVSEAGQHNVTDETRKGGSRSATAGPSPLAALVRRHDRDRYQTALFAPADRREALFALYA